MIYLDNAASMPIRTEVRDLLQDSFAKDFANPSAAHRLGRDILSRVDECRRNLLDMVCGKDFNFLFTSSATESNNQIILGRRGKVLASYADHASVVVPVSQKEHDYFELGENGDYSLERIIEKISEDVTTIVLTHVNGQSGVVADLKYLSQNLKSRFPRLYIHVDGVQAFGKVRINLSELQVDSYSISSHKVGGPKGTAGLYFRKDSTLTPLLFGGAHEGGLRASTLAAPLIFAFNLAAQKSYEGLGDEQKHIQGLVDKMQRLLKDVALFPFKGTYIQTMIIEGISTDIIMRHLEQEEIYVATSSACSSKIKGENKLFSALGIQKKNHKNVLRVSFCSQTTPDEIEVFCEKLKQVVKELKGFMGS